VYKTGSTAMGEQKGVLRNWKANRLQQMLKAWGPAEKMRGSRILKERTRLGGTPKEGARLKYGDSRPGCRGKKTRGLSMWEGTNKKCVVQQDIVLSSFKISGSQHQGLEGKGKSCHKIGKAFAADQGQYFGGQVRAKEVWTGGGSEPRDSGAGERSEKGPY